MILEEFLKSQENRSSLSIAQSALHRCGGFALFSEICHRRSAPQPSKHPIENAALRASWKEGYIECLRDIFEFFPLYAGSDAKILRRPDYGAAQQLLKDGEINEREYAELTDTTPAGAAGRDSK